MSPDPRLFISTPLKGDDRLDLDKDQTHYLISVMRRKLGDGVRLFNGCDGEWQGEITHVERRKLTIWVKHRLREQRASPDLTLCFAPVKKARTDFIIEKATELGAHTIIPVITQRTIAQRVRTDRFDNLAREAAEQTERLDIPHIHAATDLNTFMDQRDQDRVLIFCDEAGDNLDQPWGGQDGRAKPIAQGLADIPKHDKWAIVIGPEGGFTPQERMMLHQSERVLPVCLGPRILRADTAVVAAMSVFMALKGDWC